MSGLTISGGDIAAILISIVGWAMSWGSLRQRVKSLEIDMTKLSTELGKLQGMSEKLVKIETMLSAYGESLRDLSASVRWMREPARYPHEPDQGGSGGHGR